MKRNIRIFLIILIELIFFTNIVSNVGYAVSKDDVGKFNGTTTTQDGVSQIQTINLTILTVVRTVGVGVSLVILMVIAIKYILASAGERADIKKYAITFVIGVLVFFGATGIIEILQNTITTALNG